jgi:hypothetical protein
LVGSEKEKVGDEDPEDIEAPVSPTFIREGGRRSRSPRLRDMRFLESLPPKSTDPCSKIRWLRRPNTGDSGASSLYI